jgi:hypothetical protein
MVDLWFETSLGGFREELRQLYFPILPLYLIFNFINIYVLQLTCCFQKTIFGSSTLGGSGL